MQDQAIQIQRIQSSQSGYKLSVYGKIPLAAIFTSGYIPANDSKSMDVTIDFNEADMERLFLFLQLVLRRHRSVKRHGSHYRHY